MRVAQLIATTAAALWIGRRQSEPAEQPTSARNSTPGVSTDSEKKPPAMRRDALRRETGPSQHASRRVPLAGVASRLGVSCRAQPPGNSLTHGVARAAPFHRAAPAAPAISYPPL